MAAFLFALPAQAVTVIVDGGEYDIGGPFDETEFTGEVSADGGSGMWMVTFDSTPFEASGVASATIGNITAGTFTDLTISWISTMTNTVLASAPVTPILTELATDFTSPDNQIQKLVFSWDDSMDGAGFDVEVAIAPIPLPPAALLFLSALAGLGLLGWRRHGLA